MGPQGEKGEKGDTGPQGPKGEPGDASLELEDYYNKTQVAGVIADAITNASSNYATAAQGALAETAAQPGDAPKDGKDYVWVVNNGIQTWVEVAE